jgi:replicative DNA helicase
MSAETLTKIPNNADVERNILGVLMLASDRIGEVAEILEPKDFFTPLYRKLFAGILQLDAAGKPVDIFTLHELMAEDKELADAGGLAYLSGLDKLVYKKAPLGEYSRIVKEAAALRNVLALCETTRTQISEGRQPSEVIDSVAENFDAIREDSRSLERGAVHVSLVTKELALILERAAEGKGQMIGAPTGYADIDRLTAGWQSGDYNILAARPSAGKTAFSLELAIRQARAGIPVAIFSLEMSRESILQRMVCREAGVDSQRLRCGRLSSEDLKKIVVALARVDRMPLWIDDSAGLRASDLRRRLRSLTKRHGIKFAVVDYCNYCARQEKTGSSPSQILQSN